MAGFQFYRTHESLAKRGWAKFNSTDFVRVLDCSAGDGHLFDAAPWRNSRKPILCCCEIDLSHHKTLNAKGYRVVELDFLSFKSGAHISHFILNPPFAAGAEHVLHAWDIAWEAEIVAFLNAETLRNPCTAARKRLVRLVEEHGEVEYLPGAFQTEDTLDRADVDVALVWLRKKADFQGEVVGTMISGLQTDEEAATTLAGGYEEINAIALKTTSIENTVKAFNAAVRAIRDEVFAMARSAYYTSLLGSRIHEMNEEVSNCSVGHETASASPEWVRNEIARRYDDLKERAWWSVLRASDFQAKLSSAVAKNLESEFEAIKALEFTLQNIYGFLLGVASNRGKLQTDMVCEVFDRISRYALDNCHFYLGWASNSKHRTCGMKVKYTRFILPGFSLRHDGLPWDEARSMSDIDKVFAMLDGEAEAEYPITRLFNQRGGELLRGARLDSTYFSIRYYAGRGTVHFFPRRKDLIDRLNRTVGRVRKWIPAETSAAFEEFEGVYNSAEKVHKAFHERVEAEARKRNYWQHPLRQMSCHREEEESTAKSELAEWMCQVLDERGIPYQTLLAADPGEESPAVPLLPAAI